MITCDRRVLLSGKMIREDAEVGSAALFETAVDLRSEIVFIVA
jgi:hypothetical protein